MNKRVLIIGYALMDSTMGSVRLRRISRKLTDFGWSPVVMTNPQPKPKDGPNIGFRYEEISAFDLSQFCQNLIRWSRKSEGAGSLARQKPKAFRMGLTSELNRWVMIPDKQLPWYGPAVRRGRQLLRQEKFDMIFASQDPRTCLLVAARLSRETGLPCVLEYRDLWTGSPYYHLAQPTPLHRWLHLRLERKALRQASRVSAVSRGIAEYLAQRHAAWLKQPVQLNYNFFDPDEYSGEVRQANATRPFTISYMGAVYGNRTPHQFFEGMRAFVDQAGLSAEQFRFRWAGAIAGIRGLDETLDRTGVRPFIDFLGQIPHRRALSELKASDASLMIQAPDDVIHIPGKLFEALGARVPLLALANPCEAAEIIQRCRAGVVCGHTATQIADGLAELHRSAGKSWQFHEAEVAKFSADSAVGKLAGLFDAATAAQPGRQNGG